MSAPAPILRADGIAPQNDYLWPTEVWTLDSTGHHFHSRWRFGIVALADGRFCTDGQTYAIRDDLNCYGRRNNFPTRTAAIRAACARLIREMRGSREWSALYGSLSGCELIAAINLARTLCASACAAPAPRMIKPTVLPALPVSQRPTEQLSFL